MNKLTKEEIKLYIKEPNRETGVKGITEDYLKSLDLDEIPEVVKENPDLIINKTTGAIYQYDSFTPRAGSIFLKPSFAGRQILLGKTGRKLHFSNGRWFSGGNLYLYCKESKE